MFDLNKNNKITWDEFRNGLDKCMTRNVMEIDNFLFQFFNISGYIDFLVYIKHREEGVLFSDFCFLFPHIHQSVIIVVMQYARDSSDEAVSKVLVEKL